MEPISLIVAAIVAAVAAKAGDRATDAVVEGGEGALRRIVSRVRERFSETADEDATKALELVEQVPDSKRLIEQLAVAVDRHVTDEPAFAGAPEGFGRAGAGRWSATSGRSHRTRSAIRWYRSPECTQARSPSRTPRHRPASPRTDGRVLLGDGAWRSEVGFGKPERSDQPRHGFDDQDRLQRSVAPCAVATGGRTGRAQRELARAPGTCALRRDPLRRARRAAGGARVVGATRRAVWSVRHRRAGR